MMYVRSETIVDGFVVVSLEDGRPFQYRGESPHEGLPSLAMVEEPWEASSAGLRLATRAAGNATYRIVVPVQRERRSVWKEIRTPEDGCVWSVRKPLVDGQDAVYIGRMGDRRELPLGMTWGEAEAVRNGSTERLVIVPVTLKATRGGTLKLLRDVSVFSIFADTVQ